MIYKRLEILQCHTRVHCEACRTDAEWRMRVLGIKDFDCPEGFTADKLPSKGLGDAVARMLRWVGIRPKKGCGCKKRQHILNRWFPSRSKLWQVMALPAKTSSYLLYGLKRVCTPIMAKSAGVWRKLTKKC